MKQVVRCGDRRALRAGRAVDGDGLAIGHAIAQYLIGISTQKGM